MPSVLITGCSSGIGRATAGRLVRAGWQVFATARRLDTLDGLAGEGCRTLPLDVTDAASMRAALAVVDFEAGPLDALVNNAGYGEWGVVEEVPAARVRQQFETNVFGPLDLTRLVLPGMRRAGRGRIVNVGSMGGRLTFPGGGIYHATKYALEALSDALRFELEGFGIDVVLVQPGLVRSGFGDVAVAVLDRHASDDSPYAALNDSVLRATTESYSKGALARLAGSPDDVARVIERALTTRRPRPRYRVTASAHVLMTLRACLPDRWWDAFLRRTYAQPGAR
jgi:NAD(P)-dependent dehydrogenase (short-subunit alcohol dehydrogenase family)